LREPVQRSAALECCRRQSQKTPDSENDRQQDDVDPSTSLRAGLATARFLGGHRLKRLSDFGQLD